MYSMRFYLFSKSILWKCCQDESWEHQACQELIHLTFTWHSPLPQEGKKERLCNCMTATLVLSRNTHHYTNSQCHGATAPSWRVLAQKITSYVYKISCHEDNTTVNICKYLQDQCQINILKKIHLSYFYWISDFKEYLNGPLNSNACDIFTIHKD